MMAALLMKVQAAGVLVRPNSAVVGLDDGSARVRIALDNGEWIDAAQVIVATNGYTNALLPDVDVRPARGQVLLTAPVPGPKLKGTFHYDEGFVYFRDLNGCILLGGARNLDIVGETTTEEGTTPLIQGELERILKEVILPGITIPIAKRWSGTMAMGSSKGPLVERISPRVGMAVRMGGMGVAIGIRVARKAAALVV
jgi:glycine/D-amino acid oxidase-like deaminating enzyme